MSVATSVIRKYLEMDEGRDYVRSVALDLVFTISTLSRSLEVNPNNIGEDKVDINANLEKIIEMAQDFLDKVLSSASNCPLFVFPLLSPPSFQQLTQTKIKEHSESCYYTPGHELMLYFRI